MLEFVSQWVINIVALVLFIVIAEMLMPSGKIKKYLGIVTGTVLVAAIITPLLELAGRDFDFVLVQGVTGVEISRHQIEKDSRLLEEEQMRQIIQVYCNDLIEQIELQAKEVNGVRDAKADIIINEDTESERFGEIKRIYLEIRPDRGDGSFRDDSGDGSFRGDSGDGSSIWDGYLAIRKVEKINIGMGAEEKDKVYSFPTELENCPPESENCPPELQKRVKDRISGIFGVDHEDIIIYAEG
jgi:stage III sporulation protein AF